MDRSSVVADPSRGNIYIYMFLFFQGFFLVLLCSFSSSSFTVQDPSGRKRRSANEKKGKAKSHDDFQELSLGNDGSAQKKKTNTTVTPKI